MTARFLVGIDLGTTNSAVAFVDTAAADPRVRVFEVPQLVAPGEVAPRKQLPSFVYLATDIDLATHETVLPWPQPAASGNLRPVVGELARSQGARMASRMIASAKSWLCHPGVDRAAPILPWGDGGEGTKLSPIAAQALILGHIRNAWDHAHPDDPIADQEVLVTVPASFDEAARELTIQAAATAGLPPVVLLEEPQAAFYAWIDGRGTPAVSRPEGAGGLIDNATAAKKLAPGEHVLVFDVGGGTTDFTLIDVDAEGFTRSAVGDHLPAGWRQSRSDAREDRRTARGRQEWQEARCAAVARSRSCLSACQGDAARTGRTGGGADRRAVAWREADRGHAAR